MRENNTPPRLIARVSWGDHVIRAGTKGEWRDYDLDSPQRVERVFKKWRSLGVTQIGWRMYMEGHTLDDLELYVDILPYLYQRVKRRFGKVWSENDAHELRWAIEYAHKYNMKLYASIVPYNEGAPREAYTEFKRPVSIAEVPWGITRTPTFAWYCKFVKAHPEYELLDRTGMRRHYGVLEWAYPEARKHWLDTIESIVKDYEPDGLEMDTRTECMCPDWADQFGFNEPIVKEYERRYGVNMLKQDFDLEKWRGLRGEYFTLFLKEIRQVLSKYKKKFHLATARGNYIGPPLGNMHLEWEKWVHEHIIDELCIGVYGWCWGRGENNNTSYGHLCNPANGIGMNPIEKDIDEIYGPVCSEYGCELIIPEGYLPTEPKERAKFLKEHPQIDGLRVLRSIIPPKVWARA